MTETIEKLVRESGDDRADVFMAYLGCSINPDERYNGKAMEYTKLHKVRVLRGIEQYKHLWRDTDGEYTQQQD